MELTIRCSTLARVMSCAGILFMNLPEEESGEPAREGTAAGEMLQYQLEHNGEMPPSTHATNGVPYDRDMELFTKPIAERILKTPGRGPVTCEVKNRWRAFGEIYIQGSYDASYAVGETLYIEDLKYGWKLVEVKPNWQLLGYAIGVMQSCNWQYTQIVLRICQPRPHHEDGDTREWTLTREELLEYMKQIQSRAYDIAQGDKQLVTSPQCQYCPAAGEACPAISKAFFDSIEKVETFRQDSLTDDEITSQLDLISRMEDVFKIKKRAVEMLAVERLRNGALIKNYQIKSAMGHRKWKRNVTPTVIQALTGIDIVDKQMLSPAQAEKLGVAEFVVNKFVERSPMPPKLSRVDSSQLGNKLFGSTKPEEIK